MTSIDIPWRFRCELGEGPHWDVARQRLLFVDINGRVAHRLDPVTGDHRVIPVAPHVSVALPIVGSPDLLCISGGDAMVIRADFSVGARRVIESGRSQHRLNDGKVDPAGRLWCGSMGMAERRPDSFLYRIDDNGVHAVLDGVTVSNGIGWDVERARMYYVDSATQRIDVFHYDVETGELDDRRPFASIAPDVGLPDGLTVDAEGCVWVALYGGGQLRRYDPDGALAEAVALPVRHPTSLAFGGAELATLFVTTSRHRLDASERAANPAAGAVLAVDAGVRGRAADAIASGVAEAIGRLPVNAHVPA